MAGVTPEGFEAKTLEDVTSELDAELRSALGESIRLDGRSVLGQIRGALAIQIAAIWTALAETSEAFDPDSAVGAMLDQIVAFSGVTPREDASPSTGTVTLTGTPTSIIPEGARVRDASTGVTVETLATVEIPGGGSIDVSVQTVETGPLEAAAGSLTEIVTPYAGWSSVTNAAALTPGRNVETDLELRARREQSLQATGKGTDGGILAALLALGEVQQAIVKSNRSTTTAADGTPPHAVRSIIYPDPGSAAVEQLIAETLFANVPEGIRAWGTDVTATITDSQGVAADYSWDYATAVDVYVSVTVTLAAGTSVAASDIETAIESYINSLLVGDDVRELRMYQAIQGVSDDVETATALKIDTVTPPVLTGDLVIAIDEIARTDTVKIVVTVV